MTTESQSAESLLQSVAEGETANLGQLQPTIIANTNINPSHVEAWWAGYLNPDWAARIQEKLDNGYITVRVQTEFKGLGNGFVTMIYLAKLTPGRHGGFTI